MIAVFCGENRIILVQTPQVQFLTAFLKYILKPF